MIELFAIRDASHFPKAVLAKHVSWMSLSWNLNASELPFQEAKANASVCVQGVCTAWLRRIFARRRLTWGAAACSIDSSNKIDAAGRWTWIAGANVLHWSKVISKVTRNSSS